VGVAGVKERGVRGLPPGASHDLIEDGAWDPTHAISHKELVARRPQSAAVTAALLRARQRRVTALAALAARTFSLDMGAIDSYNPLTFFPKYLHTLRF
jgi:hypothetical protein